MNADVVSPVVAVVDCDDDDPDVVDGNVVVLVGIHAPGAHCICAACGNRGNNPAGAHIPPFANCPSY